MSIIKNFGLLWDRDHLDTDLLGYWRKDPSVVVAFKRQIGITFFTTKTTKRCMSVRPEVKMVYSNALMHIAETQNGSAGNISVGLAFYIEIRAQDD